MTKVAILPVSKSDETTSYYAVGGNKQAVGATAGKALDALTEQLENEVSTVVIVQQFRPDRYFGEIQQKRLAELMERWRGARDEGRALLVSEQQELQNLVETELRASATRASAVLQELE